MRGILFSQMEPPSNLEQEFHEWYNSEHIPARLALEGFQRGARFEVVEGAPRFLAVYEVSDLRVFASPAFEALRANPSARTKRMLDCIRGFTRFLCEEISDTGAVSPGLFLAVNAFTVPEQYEGVFNDWYETEHIPRLMAATDWLRVRRYRTIVSEGGPWTHLALHELASREVMDSAERAHARTGPKREMLAQMAWFCTSGRWLYRTLTSTERASTQ